ncbi:MAG: hypothetical protein PUP92_35335 [Rhizonema sp. PD38]|nr:hypothetical protein [Rhizonema sp. PD38]
MSQKICPLKRSDRVAQVDCVNITPRSTDPIELAIVPSSFRDAITSGNRR